jgi:hypothetical protein
MLALFWLSLSPAATSGAHARTVENPTQYTVVAERDLLDFRYSFPTIVGSYPKLLARVRAEEEKVRSDELDGARKEAQYRADNHFPFFPHQFWRDWTLTGQSAGLLGLESHTDFFEGGAHPNHTTAWLLWDKEHDQPIALSELFEPTANYWALLKGDYCRELDNERHRRQSPATAPCPSADQVTIELLDLNLDWTFETVRIIADPYVAGSYAEGAYAVILPVTAPLIALARPEYRASFEAQRQ